MPSTTPNRVSIPRTARKQIARSQRGFTLFELLITMIIFMAIIGVILVVGTRVLASNRERSTQGVIKALELVFEDWQNQTQQKYPEAISFAARVPASPPAPAGSLPQLVVTYGQATIDAESFIAPIVDARWSDRSMGGTGNWPNAQTLASSTARVASASQFDIAGKEPGKPGDAAQPSLSLMLLAMSDVVPLEQMLSGIDPKLLKRESIPVFGWTVSTSQTSVSITPGSRLVEGPVVRDAFGFPLRFVSPLAHGGYGKFMKPSPTVDGDWVATDDGNTAEPPSLAFNPRWYSPYANVSATGTATLPITRRGRPQMMGTSTSKTQIGDGDEGLCRNGRPYFYSVGPDGDPRTQGDNVYSEFPDFSTDLASPRNPTN